jgi:RES domain-containing protein
MRFWRICRALYAKQALSGEGARRCGGRWNRRGVPVVYASTSLALAALETFVNLEPSQQPDDLVYVEGDIADGIQTSRLDPAILPANWSRSRDESLWRHCDDWIGQGESVALLVPSAAVEGEWNVLLNPAHTDFRKIRFSPARRFRFDIRMFK